MAKAKAGLFLGDNRRMRRAAQGDRTERYLWLVQGHFERLVRTGRAHATHWRIGHERRERA
jgi:hypothetical protein